MTAHPSRQTPSPRYCSAAPRSLPEEENVKLYYVRSIVPDYRNSANIEFWWFRHGPEVSRPCSGCVETHALDATEAEDGTDEYRFTESEAIALKDHLDQTCGGAVVTTIVEVKPSCTEYGALKIEHIVVGNRHRRELGDIDRLAASIAAIGLLHPIVITPDGTLIAGQRRLEACKRLGWSEIPVTTIEVDDDDE